METNTELLNEIVESEAKETDKQIEPKTDTSKVSENKEVSKEEGTKGVEAKEEPKKSRVQKRIDNLVKEKYELKQQLESLKTQPKEDPKKEPKEELRLEDFEDYDSYIEALTQEEGEAKEDEANNEKTTSKDHSPTPDNNSDFVLAYEQFTNKLDDAREKYSDFDDKVFSDDAIISEEMVIGFNDSDIGADLAYYYANNPIEALKTSRLSGRKLIKELVAKELELSNPKPIIQKQTKAPEPLEVSYNGVREKSIDEMDDQEFDQFMRSRQSTW